MARGQPGQRERSLSRRRALVLAAGLGAALALVAYGSFYEARRVVLTEVRLPGRGPRLLAAQISDVDFGGIGPRERRVESLLAGTVRPDLLAVTGDVLEFRGGRGERWMEEAVAYLDRLPAPLGTYWVVGESERHHLAAMRRALEGSRVKLLFNEEVRLTVEGRAISLFGLGTAHARFVPATLQGEPAVQARSTGLFSPLVDATDGAEGWSDYEITGELLFGDEEDFVGVMAYVPAGRTDAGYALVRHRDRHAFHLRIVDARRRLEGDVLAGPAPPAGVPLRYRLQVESGPGANRLRARVWSRDAPEPSGWQLQGEDRDAERPRAGAPGICVKGGGEHRYFGPWQVRRIENGASLGERRLEGFDLLDGSWRFRSVLREWAPPDGAAGRPYRLLLAHNPDVVLDLEAKGAGPVDLILAGHTQGGQIRLPWIGALYTGTEIGTRYDGGLFRIGERLLYINRGLGTSFVPLRFLCPPELTALSVPLGDGTAGEGA